jgi:ariadne-1
VYTIEHIEKRINEKVAELKDVLGMTPDQAIAVLRHFKWNLDKIQNEWFEKENILRKQIGIDYDSTLVKKFPHINSSLMS